MIEYFNLSDFTIDGLAAIKGSRKLVVVFPTRGSRDVQLLADKISRIKKDLGSIVDIVIVAHRRHSEEVDEIESMISSSFNCVDLLLCNNIDVADMGKESGKGADMRRAIYHINKNIYPDVAPEDVAVCFLDSDSSSDCFSADYVTAMATPVFRGYDIARAGFSRPRGRASRFAAQPLFSMVEHPMLEGLSRFSYPLSGEIAATLAFFNDFEFMQGYGVETAMDIYSVSSGCMIADVNLGVYDHYPQDDISIQKISFSVLKCYFSRLQELGLIRFENGARLSERFMMNFIAASGERGSADFDMGERKYQPLKKIVG